MGRRYPSLIYLGCVVTGIVISDLCRLPTWLYLTLLVLAFVAAISSVARKQTGRAVLLFGVVLLGFSAARYGQRVYEFGPSHLSQVIEAGSRYRVYGCVTDWPDIGPSYTNFTVEVDSLVGASTRAVRGRLLLRVSDTTTALQRGDRIEFTTRIYHVARRTGLGRFDYSRYLNLKGVGAIAYVTTLLDVRVDRSNRYSAFALTDRLRETILGSMHRNLSSTTSALAAGFLIGETRNIEPDIYRFFRDSGTLHLLAVSGSNVALVVLFFVVILRPFALSRRGRSIILLIVIGTFALLSYGEPSVVRASVMAALVIVVQLLERRYDLNNIVALTALCILLYDPSQLFDVSFQLSFAAAWGLIFVVPRIHRRFPFYHGRLWYRWLVLPLVVAMVAQVSAAPLIAFYFQRTPLISPLANLVIVPLVSLAVVGVLIMLVADLILPVLGLFLGSLLTTLMGLITALLAWFGGEGTPMIQNGDMAPAVIVAAYAGVVSAVVSLNSRRWRRWLVLITLLCLNVGLIVAGFGIGAAAPVNEATTFTVPGGVATAIKREGCNWADLVVVGLTQKEYDLCEKVLLPDLRQLGIARLRHLIVVDADHGVIDDLRRLAVASESETILVHPDIIRRFTDWEEVDLTTSVPTVSIGGSGDSLIYPALYSHEKAVILQWAGQKVVFQRRFKALAPPLDSGPVTYVTAEPWYGTASDLATLLGRDDRLVCSRIAQKEIDYELADRSDAAPLQMVVDLSQFGRFRILLPSLP